MALISFVRRVSASQLPLRIRSVACSGAIYAFINVKNQSRRYGSDSDIPKFTKVDGPDVCDSPGRTVSFESKHGDETVRLVVSEPYGSIYRRCFEMDIHVSYGYEHDKSEIIFETQLFPDRIKVLKLSLTNIKTSGAGYLKLLGKYVEDKGIKPDLHKILKDYMSERQASNQRDMFKKLMEYRAYDHIASDNLLMEYLNNRRQALKDARKMVPMI